MLKKAGALGAPGCWFSLISKGDPGIHKETPKIFFRNVKGNVKISWFLIISKFHSSRETRRIKDNFISLRLISRDG